MTIEKRSSNSYRIRLRENGKLYTRTVPYKPTQKEAYQLIRETIDNPHSVYDSLSFIEAIDKYIAQKTNVLSVSTLRGYQSIKKSLPEWFTKLTIKQIDANAVQQVINEYASDHAPKTVRNVHGLISPVIKAFNPSLILNTTLPQKVASTAYMPSIEDVVSIINESRGSEFFVPLYLACYGLRRSEICALEITDLHDDNTLTINKGLVQNEKHEFVVKPAPKTDASNRTIKICDELADAIRSQGYIYKYNPNAIDNYLRRTLPKLGIQVFSQHKLRHFYASYLHSLGYCNQAIQDGGGWESSYIMESVYRYSLDTKQTQEKISKDIESLFGTK